MEARPAGTAWLLDGLWCWLGVDGALAKVLGGSRFTPDVTRVVFALVANRTVDSVREPATAEWADRDVAVPAITSMYEDQAYRAMELLVAGDARAEVQEAAFLAVADLLNLLLWFSFECWLAHARTIAQRAS